MSLVNKSADWTPNYHKILIFFPTKSLKSLRAARIDELADSNEPAINIIIIVNKKETKQGGRSKILLCRSVAVGGGGV